MRSASTPSTPRPVRMRSMARLWPIRRGRRIVPRSTSGTPKRRQYTPSTASDGGDAQVAPEGELEPAGDGRALDGGDHRLAEAQAGRSHRPRSVVVDRPAVAGRQRLEVGAGAEGAAGAGEHGDGDSVVGVERGEGVEQLGGGRGVDGVAPRRPVDRDDADRSTVLDRRFMPRGSSTTTGICRVVLGGVVVEAGHPIGHRPPQPGSLVALGDARADRDRRRCRPRRSRPGRRRGCGTTAGRPARHPSTR